MDPSITKKLDQFTRNYPSKIFQEDQILLFPNDKPKSVLFIERGKIQKYDVTSRGDEVIVNIYKAGSIFPISWVLNKQPSAFFYKAEELSIVREVPVTDMFKFIHENPDYVLDLLSRIYRGLDGLMGRMVQLMSGTARSRLIYELIIECRRFGEKKENGILLNTNQQDIASRSGLSRETISREIKSLKNLGLVTVNHHDLLIHDVEKLESLLKEAD